MPETLLEVRDLSVAFNVGGTWKKALDSVSFSVGEGEVLGVAGESGCGKSTLGLALMRLLPRTGRICGGSVVFKGRDLMELTDEELDRDIRGHQISMIFQDPQHALNPVFRIETQMIDILRVQARRGGQGVPDRATLRAQAVRQLRETGIADPEQRISSYPFEFSGGMKQRVMIAAALSSQTALLIADEPTTALDVTIEAQIVRLLKGLADKYGSSILYISHNLGVLNEIADRLMVMYAGRVFEIGPTGEVLTAPRHPYTAGLLKALPDGRSKGERLLTMPGHVPALDDLPPGCTFHPRCPFAREICRTEAPVLTQRAAGHWCSCHLSAVEAWKGWEWT